MDSHRISSVRHILICAILLLGLASFPATAQFLPGEDPEEYQSNILPPKEGAAASGDIFSVIVSFEIKKEGVHIYKNKAYSIRFSPGEMKGARFVRILYPPPSKTRLIKDFAGEDPNKEIEVFEEDFAIAVRFQSTGKEGDPIRVRGRLLYQGCDTVCYAAVEKPVSFDLTTGPGPGYDPEALPPGNGQTTRNGDRTEPPATETEETEFLTEEEKWLESLGQVPLIAACFAAGLLLSLTPCVYPLIPITSGIVRSFGTPTRLGALSSSIIYVAGFALVYAALGAASALGGSAFSEALGSPYALVAIAVIMVALSLSMFGLYELKLPGFFTNKMQQAGTRTSKNTAGLFIMGMLGACMVGPCLTAPLAAVLGYIARRGDILTGIIMMSAVAWGISVLLIIVGTFNAVLPKSGEWLKKVNTAFGFILLALAAYYLSSIIGEGLYYLILGVLFAAATVFLGCWDKLTVESKIPQRLLRLAGFVLLAAGAGFSVSGYAEITGINLTGEKTLMTKDLLALWAEQFRDGDEEEVAAALESGRPVVLDFWAERCDGCVYLDEKVFKDPRIIKELGRFETLKINIGEHHALKKNYGVPGPPTVIFFDSRGKIQHRFSDTKTADEVLEILKKIR
jgi:thiol:disulfide interchange protein DsbD